MAIAHELERSRAGLRMINPAPYNAEAPPEALAGEITPVELHYVRSNFAVPTSHDGTLEIGGAADNPAQVRHHDLRPIPAAAGALARECARRRGREALPPPAGQTT